MTDLLALSSAVIDGTQTTEDVGPMNRINFELSAITDKGRAGGSLLTLRGVRDR